MFITHTKYTYNKPVDIREAIEGSWLSVARLGMSLNVTHPLLDDSMRTMSDG